MRDAAQVGVERDVVELESEGAQRGGRVRSDSGQRQQRFALPRQLAAMALDDRHRDRMQARRAGVVAQAAPGPHDVARPRRRQARQVGEGCEERLVERDHALDLRLLQHELADQNAVGVARPPPRQPMAPLAPVPVKQRLRVHAISAPMRSIPSAIAARGTGVSESRI